MWPASPVSQHVLTNANCSLIRNGSPPARTTSFICGRSVFKFDQNSSLRYHSKRSLSIGEEKCHVSGLLCCEISLRRCAPCIQRLDSCGRHIRHCILHVFPSRKSIYWREALRVPSAAVLSISSRIPLWPHCSCQPSVSVRLSDL